MVVKHNLLAMNANRMLKVNTKKQAKSTEKLASGYRINRAADDAAGLSISEKMRKQIRGLTQGVSNAQDGVSMLQVADGALNEVSDMLHRMTELSVQSANGTNSYEDRLAIQEEINHILSEIDRVSNTTRFNQKKLFIAEDDTAMEMKRKIQNSVGVEVGNISAGDYRIEADSSGISIAGNHYSWNDVTDKDGNALVNDSMASGTYCIDKDGIKIEFNVPADAGLVDVIRAINNTEIDVSSRRISGSGYATISDVGDIHNFLQNTDHTLVASDEGIKLDDYAMLTWENAGVDVNDPSAKRYLFPFADAGVTFSVSPYGIQSFDDLKELINNSTVKLSKGKPHDSYTIYNSGFEWWTPNNIELNISKFEIKDSDEIIDAMGLTTFDLYKERSASGGPTLYFRFVGSDWDSLAVEMYNGDKSCVMKMTDVAKNNFAQNGGSSMRFYLDNTDTSTFGFTIDISRAGGYDADALAQELLSKPNFGTVANIRGYAVNLIVNRLDRGILDGFSLNNDIVPASKPPVWIQSGGEAGDGLFISIDEMDANSLGISRLNVLSENEATNSISRLEGALKKVSQNRSNIGALQNRLEHTIDNENNIVENTTAAESLIRDADMAYEMVACSKQNILAQAGQAMLAQANQSNQGVLSLLQG